MQPPSAAPSPPLPHAHTLPPTPLHPSTTPSITPAPPPPPPTPHPHTHAHPTPNHTRQDNTNWMINVTQSGGAPREAGAPQGPLKVSVQVSRAELEVFKSIAQYAIPRLLGFDAVLG